MDYHEAKRERMREARRHHANMRVYYWEAKADYHEKQGAVYRVMAREGIRAAIVGPEQKALHESKQRLEVAETNLKKAEDALPGERQESYDDLVHEQAQMVRAAEGYREPPW